MTLEKRKITEADCRSISSNYLTEDCKKQAIKEIEKGYWVCFIPNCIGHTRAEMFERDGEAFLVDTYGEGNLQAAKDNYGTIHYRLR